MAEFPLLKMINVGNRQTPFAYPQHGTLLRGYVETGEENPLPTKDELVNKALLALKASLESQETKIKNVKITNQPTDYPDEAVKTELEAIKGTQSEIISALQSTNENLLATNEHLNSVIKEDRLQSDTQLTGSNVGYSTDTKPVGKEGDTFVEIDTKKVFLHDGMKWSEF